jgi:hypothetical protein
MAAEPTTSNVAAGLVVPIPALPSTYKFDAVKLPLKLEAFINCVAIIDPVILAPCNIAI